MTLAPRNLHSFKRLLCRCYWRKTISKCLNELCKGVHICACNRDLSVCIHICVFNDRISVTAAVRVLNSLHTWLLPHLLLHTLVTLFMADLQMCQAMYRYLSVTFVTGSKLQKQDSIYTTSRCETLSDVMLWKYNSPTWNCRTWIVIVLHCNLPWHTKIFCAEVHRKLASQIVRVLLSLQKTLWFCF